MHGMNTKRTDLNLLTVFHAVAETGSVSKAAIRLHLSQPAVSHALNRLRHLTGDALFVRNGKGLAMTAHAAQMRDAAQGVISEAQALLSPAGFNPQTSARIFKVGASDYSSLTLIPALAHQLRERAPNCVLEVVQFSQATLGQLGSGGIDCSYWGTEPPDQPFVSERLFSEKLIGVISLEHPLAKKAKAGTISLDDYLAFPHAIVSLRDPGANPVSLELEKLGRSRSVTLIGQSFAGNMAALTHGDHIMSLPSRLAGYAARHGLVTFDLPLTLAPYDYSLVWHRRSQTDAAMLWMRALIGECAAITRQT